MRLARILAAIGGALLSLAGASAQVVTSAKPDAVAVTIYRAPDRGAGEAFDREWLEGYALVTETRTVSIPAGRGVIRFEGVAAGILPESAIVTGLPAGVREKNLDAALLSPRSLYAGMLGRPVTIRRELGDRIIEERAIIRSGAEGAAILQTKDGFIAANCGPPDETIVYDGVPAGLSAKPTLSVETESPSAGQVTVTLSYLAWGFDWQANYVATMRPDGRSADLFAWVTLASSDVTSFADAETAVVAGKIAREDEAGDARDRFGEDGEEFEFRCFLHAVQEEMLAPPMMSVSAPSMVGEEIVVTGYRASMQSSMAVKRMVVGEDLGDLKLYRIPFATTVAAKSQKQVALLDKPSVPVEILYRTRIEAMEPGAVMLTLRAQNKKAGRLGVPFPAGTMALFAPRGEQRLLIGEGTLDDKAVGEEIEVEIAAATQVTATAREIDPDKSDGAWELVVTNANPHPIRFEAEFSGNRGYGATRGKPRLGRKNGLDLWAIEVPANGTKTLRFARGRAD